MQMPNLTCLTALLPAPPEAVWYWYPRPDSIWLASFLGMAFVMACVMVYLLRRVLRRVPGDLEDAAAIDGCGFWRVCWHIVMPRLGPVLALAGVVMLIGAWDDALIGVWSLHGASTGAVGFDVIVGIIFGVMMAGALFLITPVIATFFLAQRYLRTGRLTEAKD